MASLEEMKNNIWFDKFLASKNLSRDDFDNLKDKEQLQKDFEAFVFEKDCDPHVSTPEDEDNSLREEVKERLEQAQSLEYHPEGYHINEELDGAAYFCALRRLAISEDEITQENLQKHIKEESNRIATEYFCGLRDFVSGNQSQTTPQKQEKGKLVYFVASIGEMVEQNKSKEDIYQKMFKGKFSPSEAQEKLVTNITAQSNIAPVKKWLKAINYTGNLLDKIQEYEQKYPLVSMAAGIGASTLGVGIPYMAFRMSMVARNVYKEAKKNNFSFSQLVRDSKSRNQLITAGASLARIIPGGQFVAMAPAITKVFKKQFREEVKTSAGKAGEALKKIWKSKGKEGWKDLWQHGGKTAAMVGGVVSLGLGAYGAHAYFGADSVGDEVLSGDDAGSDMVENQTSQPEAPNNTEEVSNQGQMSTPLREGWGNMSEASVDGVTNGGGVSPSEPLGPVNEAPMNWQDPASFSTPLREGWGNMSDSTSTNTPETPTQETPAQEAPVQETSTQEAPAQETTTPEDAKTPEIDVNNLTEEQQHDMEMLFKRDPASANKLLGDGKWHSSAELAKMWEEGKISDEVKLRMINFAGERFDDAGHFVDANGNIDTKMEDMAKEWTAKHAETSTEAPKTEVSEPEIQKQEGVNIDEAKALKGLNQKAETEELNAKEIKQPEDTESKFDAKKIKIKEDGRIKVVGYGENGREVFYRDEEDLAINRDFDKINFDNKGAKVTIKADSENVGIKYRVSPEGELKSFSAGEHSYSSEELEYANRSRDFPEIMKKDYEDIEEIKKQVEKSYNGSANNAEVSAVETTSETENASSRAATSTENKEETTNIQDTAQEEMRFIETDNAKISYSVQEGENGYQLSYKGTLEGEASKEIERQLVGMIHQDEDGVYHLGDQVASNEKIIHTYATRQAQQLTLQKAIYEDLSTRSEAGELSPVEHTAMKSIGEKLDKYNLRESNAGGTPAHTNTTPVVSKGGRE